MRVGVVNCSGDETGGAWSVYLRDCHRPPYFRPDEERVIEMPPRLLIIAYVSPLSESVGDRRPGELAKFAADRRWDVRVPSATMAGQEAPSVGIPESQIVRAAPVPRWAQIVSSLRRAEAQSRGGLRQVLPTLTVIGREVLIGLNRVVPAVRRFLWARQRWRPDLILATGPPASVYLVASMLARRIGVPWVADYRDLWRVGNDYWPCGRSQFRRSIDDRMERRLLRSVAGCVTTSEPLAEIVRSTFGIHTEVVLNGIDRRPVMSAGGLPERPAGPAKLQASTLTSAHTGRLNPGKRDPGPLLDAVALLGPDARVHVIFAIFAGEDNGVARTATERAGVADSTRGRSQNSCDVGWPRRIGPAGSRNCRRPPSTACIGRISWRGF